MKDDTEDLEEDIGNLETWIEDLEAIEDLEEDIGTLATGSQGLEGIIEDLEGIGDLEVGVEVLEAMTEDLEVGIEDLERIEDWVWVDWSLDELASGPGWMAA